MVDATMGERRRVSMRRERSLTALLALGLVSTLARSSAAETHGGNVAKGTIGGGMLGAEVVMLTESAFRLRPGWMYVVGGVVGGGAGAYLGYRISDDSSNRPPAFLLAGGIALIIPTVMGVLTATQYEPPEPLEREDSESDEPGSDADDGARLELPSLAVAQAFSREELARFRVQQVNELHLTFLRGVF